MTLRHGAMSVRKGFVIRAICLVIFCTLILYVIHVYRKISMLSGLTPYFIRRYRGDGMESSVVPQTSPNGGEDFPWGETQGSPIINLEHKFVHFDLKGMPPTVEAFESIFQFLKDVGATGVLMEYEDMFPFDGSLKNVTNKKAYSVSDIKAILKAARNNNLQVIPLIQTFGHMEFILKVEEFSQLREVPKYPQVICPSNSKSIRYIEQMIDQVMSLHEDVQYLHIGSDEVYYIGMCPLCQERMARSRIDQNDLFLEHVRTVASYVKTKHKVQPIMWDDEFRNLDDKIIAQYGIGDLVEIVVWNYHPDVQNRLRPNLWGKYSSIFKSVWVGSAFKGADKPNSVMPNETLYLSNHYSWMNIISDYHSRINFKGIFLTGWQRYDHFSVLCEIFPVAIPSLTSCMLYLKSKGQPRMEKIFLQTSSYLECAADMMFCRFPGSQIFNEMQTFASIQNGMKRIKEQSVFLGWAQNINLALQFSSPSHVESVHQEVIKLKVEVESLQDSLVTALRRMYPEWSVQEWMLTHFYPLSTEIITLDERLAKILKHSTFPVRPLNYSSLKGVVGGHIGI